MNENQENKLTFDEERMRFEEQNRQWHREQAKLRRYKEKQQYYSQMTCKSNLACFVDGFSNGLANSLTQHPIIIIRRHRSMALPVEETSPGMQTQSNTNLIRTPRHYSAEFKVHLHIRNLAKGKASPEKQATAQECGITLKEGQTWVRDFFKGTGSKDQQ